MPVVISDEVLKEARLTQAEALIEIACRLFDAGKLDSPAAARLAGLSRTEFEAQLIARDLPLVRYSDDMWEQEAAGLRYLESRGAEDNRR
jgi:predicted HTH domain antitoxin